MEGGNGERAEASSLEASCALLEQRHVHDVYEKTAHHFRDTNYKAWPKVKQFLKSLDPGSLVADIGCGTGRYMNINNNSFKLGSDHCCHLVDIARDHGHEVMVCDNLRLPYRDNSFDSVISIAVIHHLTTPERRLVAVQELARILRPGGKLMIYVWAMEQRHRKFKSQDVLVPWHMKTRHQQQREKTKLKIEMERSSTNSVSEEDEGDSSRNSHKSFHGQRLTGCHLKMYSESPPPSESTDSGFDNSPNSNRETRVKTEMSNAPSSTKEIVEHSREEIKENKGSSAICDFPNENKTSGVAVPSIGLTQKPCRRRAGIPSRLRQHLKSLFKGRVTLQEERDANPKDIAYKKLMHQIMQEQGNSFPFPHHILEHSLSDPSIEGFAVREFPQSSRMRFASMDCEPRRSDSCCESADLVCDSSRRDSSMTQGRSDTDAGDGSRTPLSQNSEYNGLNETNQTNMPCTYQNDNAISVDAGSPSTINKLSDINTANGCHGECHWTISCTCEDNDVENTETCHLCYEQAGCDDVFDASDMVLEKDSGKIGEAKYVETEEGTSQEEATRCSDSYHEDITEEDILSTAQTLAVTKESVLLSAPASPHSTSSSWADSSSGDMSGVGDNNYNDTITDVVPNTAVSAVTNTSEDSTDSYHDAIIDNDCDSHSYNVTNSHIDVDQTNGVISDDGIVSDDDSINICNVNDAVTIGGDYDRTSKVSPGTGHSLLLAKPHKMPSLARCDSLPSDDEEWARTTAQAIEAIQTQVLQGVGSCNYCTNHQAVGQKINLGALQLNGHSVHHGVSSTSSDICSSTDDDITDSYLNSVTMTSVNHAKTTVGTTGDYMQGAVDNSRDHTLDSADTSDTFKRFYHVFREGELVELIERHVDCLDVISACYDHANWCVIAEKVQVWKI